MLRGRHRGLPVAIDKAVLLPDETLAWAEEEDALMRREAGQGLGGGLRRRMSGLDAYGNASANENGNVVANRNGNVIANGRSPEWGTQGGGAGNMV
jgi:hypothetical protein